MVLCPLAVFNNRKQYAEEDPILSGQGLSVCEAPFEYKPRRPEESDLYRVVAENLSQETGARSQESGVSTTSSNAGLNNL